MIMNHFVIIKKKTLDMDHCFQFSLPTHDLHLYSPLFGERLANLNRLKRKTADRKTDRQTCSPLGVEVLLLPVGDRHHSFVLAWQRRRRGAHGGPALRVGGAVEPRRDRGAVPAPRRPGGWPVARRYGLWLGLLLHGLHLILLCAAPGETKGRRSFTPAPLI